MTWRTLLCCGAVTCETPRTAVEQKKRQKSNSTSDTFKHSLPTPFNDLPGHSGLLVIYV
uniref:Uncharacterized protein n=1 Tax=Arion vulgaris TaxID=1028688 RepID=A0A0B7AYY3_9EUPU